MKKIVFILWFAFLLHNSYAQDSSRFQFLSKNEKQFAKEFSTQEIDTFLFFKKENFAGLIKPSYLVLYRKNNITYKQVLVDSINFSKPIEISNELIESFFRDKVTKHTTRKEKKLHKINVNSHVHLFPDGSYYHINFYYGTKQFHNLLSETKYPIWAYYKPKFRFWIDKVEEEMKK